MPDQPLYLNIPLVRSSCSALWRFLVTDLLSDHFQNFFALSCTSTLFSTIFPSLCTSLPITFSSMYSFTVSRSCQLCIPALPHRIPATSSTEYFFTGPLLPPATLTSCDMHCGVSRIHAPRRNYLYDPALLIPSA